MKPRLTLATIHWCKQDANDEGWMVKLNFDDFSQDCERIDRDVAPNQSRLEFMEWELIGVLENLGIDVRLDEIHFDYIDGGICHYMHPEKEEAK